MGWREKLGKVKEVVKEGVSKIPSYESTVEEDTQEKDYWGKQRELHGKPTTRERAKTFIERRVAEAKEKHEIHEANKPLRKELRDTRKAELELIRKEARTKAVKETEEEHYRKKGRAEGKRIALGQTGFAYGLASESTKFSKHFPMMGYSDKLTRRVGTNINKNPLMRGLIGPVRIPKQKGQKSLKRGKPVIKIYLTDTKKHSRRQKKKRNRNQFGINALF